MERGTDTGSQTLIDATVAMAASSRLAYLVSYFANPGGGWQGALIKYDRRGARGFGRAHQPADVEPLEYRGDGRGAEGFGRGQEPADTLARSNASDGRRAEGAGRAQEPAVPGRQGYSGDGP